MVGIITSFLDERDRCNSDDTEDFSFTCPFVRSLGQTRNSACVRGNRVHTERDAGSESELSSRKRGVVVVLHYVLAEDVFARRGCGREEYNNEVLGRTDVSCSWFWWGK
jgi:hypothetical protein